MLLLIRNMGLNGIQKTNSDRVDKGSLNGLRGIFAFHVMVFHACMFLGGGTWPKINLYANIDMPLFFLLSGFSLVLAYGRTKWDGSSLACRHGSAEGASRVTDAETPEKTSNIFNPHEFYKNA